MAVQARSAALDWGCTTQAMGLVPRLMAPSSCVPIVRTNVLKMTAAIPRPFARYSMRQNAFAAVKALEQQQPLDWHRLRERREEEPTALLNRIRGLLTEIGIVVEVGASKIRHKLAEMEGDDAYPQNIRLMAHSVREQLISLDQRMGECMQQIALNSEADPIVDDAVDEFIIIGVVGKRLVLIDVIFDVVIFCTLLPQLS